MSSYKRSLALMLITFLVLSAFSSTTSRAADNTPSVPPRPKHNTPTAAIDPAALSAALSLAGKQSGTIPVMVQLTVPSTSEMHAAAGGSSTLANSTRLAEYTTVVANSQDSFANALNGSGIAYTEVRRLTAAINAVQIEVDSSKVAQIAALPGVLHVFFDHEVHASLTTSVPFIGAPAAWQNGAGFTGTGIKIAIVDTGVDYRHADFGGTATSTFPTAKVVKGANFIADGQAIGDPQDCRSYLNGTTTVVPTGHGTHVAGIAAGQGVNANGTTYAGPYNSSIYTAPTFKVGPGVAPQATIYAYRVLGCNGSGSDFSVSSGINQAVIDGADVINMSLGANFGSDQNVSAITTVNAGLAGLSVAVAAGNAGDTYFIAGSPAAAANAITVAASQDPGVIGYQVTQTSPTAAIFQAAGANFGSAPNTTGVSGNVLYAQTTAGLYDGCAGYAAGTFAGKIALIDRGTCAFVVKTKNAQTAGAIGVIIVNNRPGAPPPMSGTDPTVVIPTISITQTDGATIKAELAAASVVTVTLQQSAGNLTSDLAASFTSRGPATDAQSEGVRLKPDVTAPGVSIVSAAYNTASDGVAFSGTSMATPHIAGVVALLKQLHPTWSAAQLKALIMNTATHDLFTDYSHLVKLDPGRIGAGRVDVANAIGANVIAYSSEDPRSVSVSFGMVDSVATPITLTKTVTVVNKGTASASYNVAFLDYTTVPGATYTVSPASITVAASASATVTITLTSFPNNQPKPHTHAPSVAETDLGGARAWLSEASGYLDLTPTSTGALELRVPVHALPRPESDMHAATSTLSLPGQTGTVQLGLTGTQLYTGTTFPYDEVSLVTPFELQATGTQQTANPYGNFYNYGNIHYVGFTSDYTANSNDLTKTELYFGLVTYNYWSTVNIIQPNILIDTGDPTYSYVLYTSSTNTGTTDVQATYLAKIKKANGSVVSTTPEDALNGITPDALDTNMFDTNVMVLPVFAADLGLTAGNATITYQVTTFSNIDSGQLIDSTPTLSYNVEKPVYNFAPIDTNGQQTIPGLPFEFDLTTNTIPVTYKIANVPAGSQAPPILLIHHHNSTVDTRGEVVQTQAGATGRIETIGVYRPSTNSFYLRNSNTSGQADLTISYGAGATAYPIVGDWTGAGIDTIGVFDTSQAIFYLRNSNVTGMADETFVLGYPNDMPIAGRWTGAMTHDGVGVFRPSNGLLYLKTDVTTGFAQYVMVLGVPGDVGIAGDWNGDGLDSPGVFRPSNAFFYLSNQVTNGPVFGDYNTQLGLSTDLPVVGDWTGSGRTGIGVFRPSLGIFFLKNDPTVVSAPDLSPQFGATGDIPVAGRWVAPSPTSLQSLIVLPINSSVAPVKVPATPRPVLVPGNAGSYDG